jgi:hypothetical protein
MRHRVQDRQYFIHSFCNPFSKFQILSWQLTILFHRFWVLYLQGSRSFLVVEVVSYFIFFCPPRIIFKPCSSSLRKCHACTVRIFLKYLLLSRYLFPIMLGRLNARARFRAMAEASIPLSSIGLGETSSSSSQPVDRELQTVRI